MGVFTVRTDVVTANAINCRIILVLYGLNSTNQGYYEFSTMRYRSFFLKIYVADTKKDKIRREFLKKVSYNKYNQFHYLQWQGLRKIFFLYSMKDPCKKNVALDLRSYIPIPQYWQGVSRTYDILATFKLPCNTSHIKSPAFTSALIILHYGIICYMDI